VICELTDREKKAVRTLIQAGKSANPWSGPIHAVDTALGFSTAESEALVTDLLKRRIVRIHAGARNVMAGESLDGSWWEKGDGLTFPHCIHHPVGLIPMEWHPKTPMTGPGESVRPDGWVCQNPGCVALYDSRIGTGYFDWPEQGAGPQQRLNRAPRCLTTDAEIATRCTEHEVLMFAYAEADCVIRFACPEASCGYVVDFGRASLFQ
jgi:hypothetical protein